MEKLQLVLFGRLSDEKGLWIVVKVIERMINEKKKGENDHISQLDFLIFWDGEYRHQIMHLGTLTQSIKYFWWKQREEMQRYIGASDFTLMPSTFLETFGLTALESLSLWVPVIWFKKGWVTPFIQNGLDINEYSGLNDTEKLYNCLIHLLKNTNKEIQKSQCELASKTSYKYIPDKRLKNFENIVQTDKKAKTILLASDYKTILYGIETHIHSLKDLLTEQGYIVEIFGANIPKNSYNKFIRILLLPFTIFNFIAAYRLSKHIKKLKPDIIRRHSTSRRLGWFPLWSTRKFTWQQRTTYHDLGYFHPFPSKVNQVKQIPKRNIISYLKATNSKNPIILLASLFKYLTISALRKQLKQNIDKHFVPSHFMLPITQKWLGANTKGKVMLLEHFLRDK